MQVLLDELIKKIFRFIETEYGFSLIYADKTVVKYEKDNVAISVFIEPNSREVYIMFELLNSQGKINIRLDEVAREHNPNSFLSRCYYATDADILIRYLNEAKEFINNYCRDLVYGNADLYLEYADKRERNRIEKLRDIKKSELSAKINLFWKNKDHEGIVKLCESQEENMSKSQKLKYNYSKKITTK